MSLIQKSTLLSFDLCLLSYLASPSNTLFIDRRYLYWQNGALLMLAFLKGKLHGYSTQHVALGVLTARVGCRTISKAEFGNVTFEAVSPITL